VFDLPYTTNLKNPKAGVWMFRVDGDQIEMSGAASSDGKPKLLNTDSTGW